MPYGDDPANDPADELRLLVGDTGTTPLLSDNEVAYFLAQGGAPLAGAVRAANALASRFAQLVDSSVGDVRKSYSQRAKQYRELAADLTARDAEGYDAAPIPWAGGLYRDDPAYADPALVPLYFREGMDSLPGTTGTTTAPDPRAGGECR